jgi:hypothetical protein
MTQRNNLTTAPIHWRSLSKRMLLGATIGFILISIFLLSAGEPNPEWGKLWMIRPLIIVPLAGAIGGGISYFLNQRYPAGWKKALATLFSLIIYLIGLWLGTIVGLDGTYWN